MIVALVQTVGATPPEWVGLAQYGVLGLLVLGFIFGQIVPGYIERRNHDDLARKDAELVEIRKRMEESVIPALVRVTDLLTEIARTKGAA